MISAEDYLSPQPLSKSDAIADSIRQSFNKVDLKPNKETLTPYLRHQRGPFRVVGYIAFQIGSDSGSSLIELTEELIRGFAREKKEAMEWNETRPLWQLLVCFSLLKYRELSKEQMSSLRNSLISFKDFLLENSYIDSGRECRNQINFLLKNIN